jgi:hypothetical protein
MSLSSAIAFCKKANDSAWLEWVFRLLFSAELIRTALAEGGEAYYPSDCWLMIFTAIWCYFFKLKLLGLIPLFYAMLFHYWHGL